MPNSHVVISMDLAEIEACMAIQAPKIVDPYRRVASMYYKVLEDQITKPQRLAAKKLVLSRIYGCTNCYTKKEAR